MTQINIENSMILNSKLILKNRLEIDSKIIHFQLPSFKSLEKIPNFYPKKMLGSALKHMVSCCKEDLIKNPVFFSLVSIDTIDEAYQKRFINNKTITEENLKNLKENYNKSVDMITYLLNDKLSGLDFGKKFWTLEDYKNVKI